jgi:hypothetical protein
LIVNEDQYVFFCGKISPKHSQNNIEVLLEGFEQPHAEEGCNSGSVDETCASAQRFSRGWEVVRGHHYWKSGEGWSGAMRRCKEPS